MIKAFDVRWWWKLSPFATGGSDLIDSVASSQSVKFHDRSFNDILTIFADIYKSSLLELHRARDLTRHIYVSELNDCYL